MSHHLKNIVETQLPTYIRDSRHLKESLLLRFPNGLPPNARLFSVDAVSMYTNIDTHHGISTTRKWLELYEEKFPNRYLPSDFLGDALELIMTDNILQFGDLHYRQLQGTAMGTSSAVNYANLYVRMLTRTILETFNENLPFYMRLIEDGIGIWIDHPDSPTAWTDFLTALNNWGVLRWTTTDRVNSLVFLDLTVSIDPLSNKLYFKSYSKDMNLHLYIPPTSAHPPGMLKGLIYGRVRHFYEQNSNQTNFITSCKALLEHLIARGYSRQNLLPLFLEITRRLEKKGYHQNQRGIEDFRQPIYFHLKYHPRGIHRLNIRKIFTETIAPMLKNRRLVVAVSRQRNLGDRVCNTTLPSIKGKNPTNYLP